MGTARTQIERRRAAKTLLQDVIKKSGQLIVIHYSCESFYDRQDGSSPRITSIAVRNFESGQTTSFSIHQMAEREGCSRDDLERQYDRLEKLMLDEFFEYVRLHATHTWLHWNMRDINFGFQALAHRYRVLKGHPVEPDESRIVDLAQLLPAIYGAEYIDHPRLATLVARNQMTDKDFLIGPAEAAAFQNKEYVRLHQSTLRKVQILSRIAERANNGSLKVNTHRKDVYGSYLLSWGEIVKEHPLVSLIMFALAIISFVISISPLPHWFYR